MVDYRSQSYAKRSESFDDESGGSDEAPVTSGGMSSADAPMSVAGSVSRPSRSRDSGGMPGVNYTPADGGIPSGPDQNMSTSRSSSRRGGGGSSGGGSSSNKKADIGIGDTDAGDSGSSSKSTKVQPESSSSSPYRTVTDRQGNVKKTFDTREEYRRYQIDQATKQAVREGSGYIEVGGRIISQGSATYKRNPYAQQAVDKATNQKNIRELQEYAKKQDIEPETVTSYKEGVRIVQRIYKERGKEIGRITERYRRLNTAQDNQVYVYDYENQVTRPAKGSELQSPDLVGVEDENARMSYMIRNPGGNTRKIKITGQYTRIGEKPDYVKLQQSDNKDVRTIGKYLELQRKAEQGADLAKRSATMLINDPIGVFVTTYRDMKQDVDLRLIFGDKLGDTIVSEDVQAGKELTEASSDFVSALFSSRSLDSGVDATDPSTSDKPNNKQKYKERENVKQSISNIHNSKNKDSLFINVLYGEQSIDVDYQNEILSATGNLITAAGKKAATSFVRAIYDQPLQVAETIAITVGGVTLAGKGAAYATYKLGGSAAVQSFVAKAVPSAIFTGISATNVMAQKTTAGKVGAAAQDLVTGAAFLGVGRAFQAVDDVIVTSRRTRVSAGQVFDESVLRGKNKFPMAKSVEDSVNSFRQTADDTGKLFVQSSSPAPLKGTTVGAGPRGAANIEDAGLYVTPAGEGSPYFLRVSDALDNKPVEVEYRLFPRVQRPTVFKIGNVKGVKRLPDELIKNKGFDEVNKYLEQQAGDGYIYITKRSEIGQRGLKGKGQGTGEKEGILPVGTKLLKGDRLTPKDYARKLYEDAEIDIRRLSDEIIAEGVDGSYEETAGGMKILRFEPDAVQYSYTPKKQPTVNLKNVDESIVAHEILHYKTQPTIDKLSVVRVLDEKLPYRAKPSEIISFGLQKHYAKTGFRVSDAPKEYTILNNKVVRIERYNVATGQKATAKEFDTTVREFEKASRSTESLSSNKITTSLGIIPFVSAASGTSGASSAGSSQKNASEALNQSLTKQLDTPEAPASTQTQQKSPISEPSMPISSSTAMKLQQESLSGAMGESALPSFGRGVSPVSQTPIQPPQERRGPPRDIWSLIASSRGKNYQSRPLSTQISRGYSSRSILTPQTAPPRPPRLPRPQKSPFTPTTSSKKRKGFGQGLYTPSVTAVIFDLQGDQDRFAALTGLGLRPLQRRK